jgi:chromosome segregation ATPase
VATMLAQARNAKRQVAADAEKQRATNENLVLIERLKNESAERIKAEEGRTIFVKNLMDRLTSVEQTVNFLQGELAARHEQVQSARAEVLDERQKKHDALGELHAQGLKHEHDMHEQKECFEKDMYELKLKHAEEIAALRADLERHRSEIEKLRAEIATLRGDTHAG